MSELIKVDGIEEVTAWLSESARIVQGSALVKGLSAGGNVIADELERRTPVRDSEESGGNSLDRGVLRESVQVEVKLDSQARGGSAIVSHGKNSYVANYLEYGHRLLSHGAKDIYKRRSNNRPRSGA